MSRAVLRHVLHYHSMVDDTDQPYIVSAPDAVSGSLPCVVLLHDILTPATREQFVENALRKASRWQTCLAESETPFLLVQPMGRGNAGWLGVGGRDLFDVLSRVRAEFPVQDDQTYLIGVGGGATGALQLACWFPDRWAAVAVAGPVVDERWELPIDQKEMPVWEQNCREAHRPASLMSNLAEVPLLVDLPWWFDGLDGTPHPEQHHRLKKLIARYSLNAEVRAERPLVPGETQWPADPKAIVDWLMSHRSISRRSWSHTTYSPRSWVGDVRVERLAQPGRPSKVTVAPASAANTLSVRTKGVADIAVRHPANVSLRLDRQKFAAEEIEVATDELGWIRFQHLGERWQTVSPEVSELNGASRPVKSLKLPGPAHDMRWDGVAFVHGTMGDDFEIRTLERLAKSLRDAWVHGEDSVSLHPGDKTTLANYPVVPDVEVDDVLMSRRHLVLLGSPRSNLVLARFRGRLAVDWPAPGPDHEGIDPFRFAGKLYRDSSDGLILLGGNPDCLSRYVLVMTATTSESLVMARRFRTAFLPDYVLYHGREVRSWGFCGPDWVPIGR